MKSFFLTLLALTSVSAFSQTSYVAPTTVLSKKGYQIGIGADYFKSSKRVDKKGKKFSFTDGDSFSRVQGEVTGYIGLTDNFQLGAGIRGRKNASTTKSTITGKNETETATGLESTFLNLMYAFKPVDRLQYTLEGTYRYTPYTNSETTPSKKDDLILGNDGNEYSAGLGVTYSSPSNNFISGRVGYRKPGKDLSSEIYWQIEAAVAWREVALVAGLDGVSSMNNDAYEGDDANRPVYNTGTSNIYKGINREWMAPYAGINVALGKLWRIEAKGSQVLSGKSTDLGTSFGFALIRRVDDAKGIKVDRKFKQYDIEASITKVSSKKAYVVIDKGIADDVRKGMKIDFFEFDYVGGNILVASGIVFQTKATSSIVKINQIYNTKKELKEGILARGSYR